MATDLAGSCAVGLGTQNLFVSARFPQQEGGRRTLNCSKVAIAEFTSRIVVKLPSSSCKNCVISSGQCSFFTGRLSDLNRIALPSVSSSAFTSRLPHRSRRLQVNPVICAGKVPRSASRRHNGSALPDRHPCGNNGENLAGYSNFSHEQSHHASGPGFRERANPVHVSASVAERSGKVGVIGRLGNVAMASFGLKERVPFKGRGGKADVSKVLSRMLPFVVCATAVASLAYPPSFSWFSKQYYAPALGGIMLSIGVQLAVKDFVLVFQRPLPVLLGFAGQYLLKPLIGLAVVSLFRVPPLYAAGLLLTASVAGAQLSSYATFLSEGDVAFSIVLTSLTTVASVALTPVLTKAMIGSVVPVDVGAMAKSILQVVILPVFAGLALNTYAKPVVDRIRPALPLLAMICTSLCIGSPLALNQKMLLSPQGLYLLLPVIVFHIFAFSAGYWLARLPQWRQEEKVSQTISLCTGMQSSTLAMLLASQFLGPTHSVPPACSVVVMAIMGLSLGSFWGKGLRIREVLGIRKVAGVGLPRHV